MLFEWVETDLYFRPILDTRLNAHVLEESSTICCRCRFAGDGTKSRLHCVDNVQVDGAQFWPALKLLLGKTMPEEVLCNGYLIGFDEMALLKAKTKSRVS